MRSRAVSDERQVRIALSVALLRRGGWAPSVPDPQHIAFATDEAVSTAEAMRELGAPRRLTGYGAVNAPVRMVAAYGQKPLGDPLQVVRWCG